MMVGTSGSETGTLLRESKLSLSQSYSVAEYFRQSDCWARRRQGQQRRGVGVDFHVL